MGVEFRIYDPMGTGYLVYDHIKKRGVGKTLGMDQACIHCRLVTTDT